MPQQLKYLIAALISLAFTVQALSAPEQAAQAATALIDAILNR